MKKHLTLLLLITLPFLTFSQSFFITNDNANAGETLTVNFTGLNTHFSQGSSTIIHFDFKQASQTVVNSILVICETKMQVNITVPKNTQTGDYSISVFNNIDGYMFQENIFHVNGKPLPDLISINPNIGNAGETIDVIFTGLNTSFTQASNTHIDFDFYQGSQTVVNSFNILSDNKIMASITVPKATAPGNYTANVYNDIDGHLSLKYGFGIKGMPKPELILVSPDSAMAGENLDIIFTGINTHFNQASATSIYFDFYQGSQTVVTDFEILSDTELKGNLTVPLNCKTGDYSASIYNDLDGYLSFDYGFHVKGMPKPELISVSPDSAMAGENLDIIFTGINTHFNQASATSIYFDFYQGSQTVVTDFEILSDTELKGNLTVPLNCKTGDYSASIYNDLDGYLSFDYGFHVKGMPKPELISVSPDSAMAGENLDVVFTGINTHFNQASATSIYFDFFQGSQTVVADFEILSETQLKANLTVPLNCKTGDYSASIYNDLDGYLTLFNGFRVCGENPPALIALSPDNAEAGETLDIIFTGVNTHFDQASSTFINLDYFYQGSSTTVNSITKINNTQLKANIKIPAKVFPGNYGASVYNEIDGYLYLPNSFYLREKSLPSIKSISPDQADPGQTLNITITGLNTNFFQSSTTLIDFEFNASCGTIVNSINILSNTSMLANITIPKETKLGSYNFYLFNTNDNLIKLENGFNIGKTEIKNYVINPNIKVYPNPTSGKFTIQNINYNNSTNNLLSIYSANGQLIYNQLMQGKNTEINLENYSKGIYFVKILSDLGVAIEKIVVD